MTVLRAAYVEVKPRTEGFDAELSKRLRRIDASKDGNRIGQSISNGMQAGATGGLAQGMSKSLGSLAGAVGGPAIAAGAAIGAAMAPAAGAALASGILLAVGGGVLGAGIAAAAKSPKVQEAWKGFGERAKESFKDFGKPFEGPMIRAAGTFGDALERMAPTLNRMGKFMAPIIDKLAPAFASMAERALPGIEKAMQASAPLFETLADKAPQIGDAISKFFESVAKGGPGAKTFLSDLFDFLIWVIPKVGQFVSWLAAEFVKQRTRLIVTWQLVSGAVKSAWEEYIQPAVTAIVAFFRDKLAPAALWLWNNVLKPAWNGISTAVKFAWENVIKPAVGALMGFVKNFLAPTIMWLWNNVIKPAWAGISFAIKAAWVIIQIIFAAIRMVIRNVLAPVFTWLYQKIIKPVWEKGIRPVFQALGGFIKDKVAPAFRTGVGAIASAWDKVKEAASKPVRFIVDTVLNKGIIGGINFLASKVGVKDRIPEIRWGGLSGSSKARSGERISGNTKYGDGYGHGDGHGVGDGLGSILAGPAKWLANRMGLGRLVSRFGRNPFVSTLTGAANRAKDFALTRIQQLIGEFLGAGGGGSVGTGGLRSGILGVLGALRGAFGSVPVISGLRPGATTLSGNTSYHASGRAIDIAPVQAWAQFLNARYGGQLRELITPWNELNILNGRPHRYTGAVWNQHNFAGGNAHIHAAMANGGTIREPVFGVGRSGRTYSFAERGSENVWPHGGVEAVVQRLDALIASGSGGETHVHLHNSRATVGQVEAMFQRQALRARLGRSR